MLFARERGILDICAERQVCTMKPSRRQIAYVLGAYHAVSDSDARQLLARGRRRLRVRLTVGTFLVFGVTVIVCSLPLWWGELRHLASYIVLLTGVVAIPALWMSAGRQVQRLDDRVSAVLGHVDGDVPDVTTEIFAGQPPGRRDVRRRRPHRGQFRDISHRMEQDLLRDWSSGPDLLSSWSQLPSRARRDYLSGLAHGESLRDVLEPMIMRDPPAASVWPQLTVTKQRQVMNALPYRPLLPVTNRLMRMVESIRHERVV